MMTSRSVDVTVSCFFRGRGAHLHDLDIERESLPRQWVIGVDIRTVAANLDYCHRDAPVAGVELHHHAGPQFAFEQQVFYRDPLLPLGVHLAVGVPWCNTGCEHVTACLARHGGLQAGDNIAGAEKKRAGLSATGGFQLFAGLVAQGVMKDSDGVGTDIHDGILVR